MTFLRCRNSFIKGRPETNNVSIMRVPDAVNAEEILLQVLSTKRPSVQEQKRILKGKTFPVKAVFTSDRNDFWGVAQTPLGDILIQPCAKQAPLFAVMEAYPNMRSVLHSEFKYEDTCLQTRLDALNITHATFQEQNGAFWFTEIHAQKAFPYNDAAYKKAKIHIPSIGFNLLDLIYTHETGIVIDLANEPVFDGITEVSKLLQTGEILYECDQRRVERTCLEGAYAEGMQKFSRTLGIRQRITETDVKKVRELGNAGISIYFDRDQNVVAGVMLFKNPLSLINGIKSAGCFLLDVFVDSDRVDINEGLRILYNLSFMGLRGHGKRVSRFYTHSFSDNHARELARIGFNKKVEYGYSKAKLLEHVL